MTVTRPKLSQNQLADIRQALLHFYDDEVQELGPDRSGLANAVRNYMLKDLYDAGLILEIKHTGSAYEGAYVGSDYDYDAMIVLNTGKLVRQKGVMPANVQGIFRVLRANAKHPRKFKSCFNDKNFLKVSEMREKMRVSIDRWKGTMPSYAEYTEIRLNLVDGFNPKVQVSATYQKFSPISFTMDFAVSVKVGEKDYYTASPITQQQAGDIDPDFFWKKTRAYQETSVLKTIDQDNLISKKMLRIYKGIRMNSTVLSALPPYATKSCFLRMRKTLGKFQDESNWSDELLANRFIDFVYLMYQSCEKGRFNTYIYGINVLETPRDHQHAREAAKYLGKILNRKFDGIKQFICNSTSE